MNTYNKINSVKHLNSGVKPLSALQNISLWENVLLVKRHLESGRLKERKQQYYFRRTSHVCFRISVHYNTNEWTCLTLVLLNVNKVCSHPEFAEVPVWTSGKLERIPHVPSALQWYCEIQTSLWKTPVVTSLH